MVSMFYEDYTGIRMLFDGTKFGFGLSSSEESRMRDRESLTRGTKVIMEKKYETKSPLEGIGIKHW